MTVSIGRVYIQGRKVNVRQGPGLNHTIIRKVDIPMNFLVSQQQMGWLEINGADQWIFYDPSYIIFLKNVDSIEPPGILEINGIGVNVRKGPSKNFKVKKQLNKTDSITKYAVYAVENGWLNVGTEEWIFYDPSYINYPSK